MESKKGRIQARPAAQPALPARRRTGPEPAVGGMAVYTSMWTYAWDLDDCGIDSALRDLREHGVGDVAVATAYHSGRFLQIRSPRRKIYLP